jgi:hypothetical protein
MKHIFKTLLVLFTFGYGHAQNTGIGTTTPDFKLHVLHSSPTLLKLENSTTLDTGVVNALFYKTGTFYSGAIKTIGTGASDARLGFFTKSSTNAGGLQERLSILDDGKIGIGTTSPSTSFHIISPFSHPVIIDGGDPVFISWAENGINRGYLGSYAGAASDVDFGTYSTNTTGKLHFTIQNVPKMTIDVNGFVGIGNTSPISLLDVRADGLRAANFESSTVFDGTGVYATCASNPGSGTGVFAMGGAYGVQASALNIGPGNRYGVKADASGGSGTNYGISSFAVGGDAAYGVYASALFGTINYAGYFAGSVYTTGSYLASDRKLKSGIQPVTNALSIINQLMPSSYTYRTDEFQQMQLPDGVHVGLIADEVRSVMPGIVKKAIQPAEYENHDEHSGKKLSERIEFEAVNYSELIPLLIGGMKEQQGIIETQNKKIDQQQQQINELLKEIQLIKEKVK